MLSIFLFLRSAISSELIPEIMDSIEDLRETAYAEMEEIRKGKMTPRSFKTTVGIYTLTNL